MRTVAMVQARMNSTRFPGKVMEPISGLPMIEFLLTRLSRSKQLDQIIVVTSDQTADKPLVEHVKSLGYTCQQGSEQDVLDRYFQAAKSENVDVIVRITGDCPLMDPALVDEMLVHFRESPVDYLSNIAPPTYPDGLDVEIFTFSALELAATNASKSFDREHVTPYLRDSSLFRKRVIRNSEDLSRLRWTVDEPEDLQVVAKVVEHFAPDIHFSWQQVRDLQINSPALFQANRNLGRNEGANMNSGQKLWKRAKKIIPGGNMLLSKRAEMFLPGTWPTYFSKAKGCTVWDLDGNAYIDMSIMGVGTNTLGYGQEEVDLAVRNAIDSGNMSTLNCPEEVYLAERLIELHPWADMVRFARTGGEANAIAIRIARSATGKDKVAICGYHGWHDWYLSANLSDDENLSAHLLPGLEPIGVPRNLRGTVFPFSYNNYAELEAILNLHDIGVIKMEVVRNIPPEDDFLHKVRQLATQRDIVLIFDECTSGFRQTFGGLHKLYDVEPDMAVFGKALGNGYAITAVIGRREIMEAAQSTFISSTFWTERIGPSAALKTLEVMDRVKSWECITQRGMYIREGWKRLASKHELEIDHWGIPSLPGFSFKGPSSLAYKTLITQELLKNGFLSSNAVYVCTEHTPEIIETYFGALDPIFALIKECEDGRPIDDLLEGPICHGGFKRLN